MNPVADIIAHRLNILFIGFNPGLRSAMTGHHFAGHSNRFWKLLALAGLTPYQLKPAEDRLLLSYQLGITNIVARPSKTAAEISKSEYSQGRLLLIDKLRQYQPIIACYAGIGVYKELARLQTVCCGLQPAAVASPTVDFVLPSPSGLNRIKLADQLQYYVQLEQLLHQQQESRQI